MNSCHSRSVSKQVQLSEQDTKALFNLMDVNRDGKAWNSDAQAELTQN